MLTKCNLASHLADEQLMLGSFVESCKKNTVLKDIVVCVFYGHCAISLWCSMESVRFGSAEDRKPMFDQRWDDCLGRQRLELELILGGQRILWLKSECS